jgi:hypothetical protein
MTRVLTPTVSPARMAIMAITAMISIRVKNLFLIFLLLFSGKNSIENTVIITPQWKNAKEKEKNDLKNPV